MGKRESHVERRLWAAARMEGDGVGIGSWVGVEEKEDQVVKGMVRWGGECGGCILEEESGSGMAQSGEAVWW